MFDKLLYINFLPKSLILWVFWFIVEVVQLSIGFISAYSFMNLAVCL